MAARPLTYRDATVDDAAGIAAVQLAAWRSAYRDVMPVEFLESLDHGEAAAAWATRLRGPSPRCLLVAVSAGDQVVGFATAGPAMTPASGDDGELYALNVDPAAWGGGVGSALLLAVHERLRASGHRTARLWVVTQNARARSFYARHGWEADGTARVDEVGLSGRERVPVEETRYAVDLDRPGAALR